MNTLVLFDVDGTLVSTDVFRHHKKAFAEAFRCVYSTETTIDTITHYGMTDKKIIISVLKKFGLDRNRIEEKIDLAMGYMIKYFEKQISSEKIVPLPGVLELIKTLTKKNIMLGLVTGNIENIARTKLEKASIYKYFKLGGFGNEDTVRSNLVKLAINRAEELGLVGNKSVFVVGDTPEDIKSGKNAGVKTIAVATGNYSRKELKEANPDFVLKDLKNRKMFLDIVGK